MTKAIYKIKYLLGGLLIDLEGESITNTVGSKTTRRHREGGRREQRKEEGRGSLWWALENSEPTPNGTPL